MAQIKAGMVVLLGVGVGDTEAECDRLAEKVLALRIFDDAEGRMNEPLGPEREILCVSQFTLYGDTRKGTRPSYIKAARPEDAEPLYDRFCERTGAKKGVFGACMGVALINDGPVTVMVEVEPRGARGGGARRGRARAARSPGRAVGDGPPLLLLNGYAATGADWDPGFLGALAAHFRVICPDNVGLGRSALADGEEVGGVAGMTADMVALLDALEIERAAVVGWSMGGFVAQSLVREAPERVARARPDLHPHRRPRQRQRARPEVWRRLIDHSGTPREQATRLISLLFPPDRAAEADERFGDLVAAARAELPERVLFMQEEALVEWHGRPTPLPVARSRRSRPRSSTAVATPSSRRATPRSLARVHPGAAVTVLPDCAHAPMAPGAGGGRRGDPRRPRRLKRSAGRGSGGDGGAVAPVEGRLRRQQLAVGGGVESVGVALAGGDPVGDADPFETLDLGLGQRVDQPLDAGDRAAGGRLGKQDRELVAADSEALVGPAGRRGSRRRRRAGSGRRPGGRGRR